MKAAPKSEAAKKDSGKRPLFKRDRTEVKAEDYNDDEDDRAPIERRKRGRSKERTRRGTKGKKKRYRGRDYKPWYHSYGHR